MRLASDLVQVDAGSTVPLAVEASNRGDESDTFEIQIEGLDPEWTAIPVPSFSAEPHENHTCQILLKPPRVTESLAGTYPFVVTLRSLQSGDSRSAQGVLEIKPFHHISVDVSPKKGSVSPLNKVCDFEVTVMNLGNSEHSLQLFASDPEDECAFDFDPEKVTVGPGQQKPVTMAASSKRRPFLSNSRLYGISVSARSVSMPTVVGNAQAQLEQKALVSPGGFVGMLIVLLLIVGWAFFLPKPPTLDVFSVTPKEIMLGDSITIEWRASPNAKSVRIVAGDEEVFANQDIRGVLAFTPKKEGEIEVSGSASLGDRTSSPKSERVRVLPRPIVPLPEIRSFKVEPSQIALGEAAMVKFEVNEAVVKATLWPEGKELDPRVGEFQVTPGTTGTVTYRLVVENKEGKRAEQSAAVKVEKASKAKILIFNADYTELDWQGGVSRLEWNVSNASIVEIAYPDENGRIQKFRGEPSGTLDVNFPENRTSKQKVSEIILTATDAEGLTTKKSLKVTVKSQPAQPPDPDPGKTSGG